MVAFLRGINLGRRRIKNAELAEVFRVLGYDDVSTYRASGNVLLSGPADEAAIEAGLERELGYEVRTFLRTRDELAEVVSPFTEAEHASHGKLQVTFLKSAPDAGTIARALAFASDDDLLAIQGRELYWLPRAGISTSDLDHTGLHRVLGLGTTRTMGTVENIRKKLG